MNILNICVAILLLYIGLQDNEEIQDLVYFVDEEATGLRGLLYPAGTIGLIRTGMMIPVALIGILGALRFNKYMILCAAVWYIIDLIAGLIILDPTNTVLSVVYCYAHIHLLLELRSGTITDENYKQTEQYCCFS